MKNRLLSFVLALGMLLSGSMTAFAEETQANVFDTELLKDYEIVDIFGAGEPFTSSVEIEKDKYVNITTDSLDCWGNADSFTFLKHKDIVDTTKYMTSIITTTVSDVKGSASPNAASGPMMRTDLTAGSKHVLLRVRPKGQIVMSWRLAKDDVCKYIVGPTVQRPVKLKLERAGDLYTAYYKNVSTEETPWIEIGSVSAYLGESIHTGFCTFAIDQSTPVTASLRRLKIKNYTASQSTTETSAERAQEKQEDLEDYADDAEKIRLQEEKKERLKAFYLIEKFEDMSLTVGEQSVENAKWHTSEASPSFVKDEDGTVWWVRNKVPTLAYVGKPTWADYKMSFDFVLDSATAENKFTIYVRTKPDVIPESAYKPSYYSLNINNKQIYLMKALPFRNDGREYNKLSTTIPDFADGKKHTMVIEAFDNTLKLYVDGKVFFNYVDGSSFPHTRGLVGFDTRNVNIKISNLIVEKMEDELGGVYDNYIGYSFDEPILDIMKKSIVIGE